MKSCVPNTTPPLALGLVKASILSDACEHIPASQERKAFPLQSSTSGKATPPLRTSTQLEPAPRPQHSAFRATKFSLGTVPFLSHIFVLGTLSAQKGITLSLTNKEVCSKVHFQYFLQLCKQKGKLIIVSFYNCTTSRSGMH